MDTSTSKNTDHHLLRDLNEPQCEAVSAEPSNMLVLAGAGSGKTRVLIHRIAWLIEECRCSPFEILAVTFTNKASHEMRSRIESVLNINCQVNCQSMWVGTFHGLSHRLLRMHWQDAGLPESFQILDTDDQARLVKRIHKALELDDKQWAPKQSQWFINGKKEQGLRANKVPVDDSYHDETMIRVYKEYEKICEASGLVDFTELLLRSLEMLQKNDALREHYQQRFKHILVDEFQDTNQLQYEWLEVLTGAKSFVMAVGDDDQSIYSWRGAKVENIHKFTQDHSNCKMIRLEQNYRSTQTILSAANAVIENNTNRLGKELWSDGKTGEPIKVYSAFNERDEAYFIVSEIKRFLREDVIGSEVAILYRSNAQSRVLEEQLIDRQVAYRIYGGLKFFDRQEIKDSLAYLRLTINRNDDAAFERVINLPTRGIGNTTLNHLRMTSRDRSLSMWDAAQLTINSESLSARAVGALKKFIELIADVENDCSDEALGDQTELVLKKSGLLAHYQKDKTEKGLSRMENLAELVTATKQFSYDETLEMPPLAAFLAHIALEAGEGQSEPSERCVNLMTLHAAKGLEFPIVFIAGLEEELFPHKMSMDDPKGLEEERRLCYVGMTRAKNLLYMTYAETRTVYGREAFNFPSRFLAEIPEKYISKIRTTAEVRRPSISSSYGGYQKSKSYGGRSLVSGMPAANAIRSKFTDPDAPYQLGQMVSHPKFGQGVVIDQEGSGQSARVQVKFDKDGTKWLVAGYAKLEIL